MGGAVLKGLKFYYSRFGINGLIGAAKAKFSISNGLIAVARDDIRFPFFLRYGTSDMPTYDQVFFNNEYGFDAKPEPTSIIDAGANIGLASIFFANKYPDAKIIALEPEATNFELLLKNIEPYENITAVNAALWDKNEQLEIIDPGLGKWGFMTQDIEDENKYGNTCHKINAMTVGTIMKEYSIDRVSILKIDIEGAEKEVFNDSSLWIEKVDGLIVELHERMKSGCNRSFYNGSNGFNSEWQRGENVYLSRGNLFPLD